MAVFGVEFMVWFVLIGDVATMDIDWKGLRLELGLGLCANGLIVGVVGCVGDDFGAKGLLDDANGLLAGLLLTPTAGWVGVAKGLGLL
eukprot:177711-Amorphochlora_amoeboformis.AAC.2